MKDESKHNTEIINAEKKRLDDAIERLSNQADIAVKKKDALYKRMVEEQKSQNMWDIILGSMIALFFIIIVYRAIVMN